MLCQFTVKNFQCIKDELTLDMQATNITENAQSVLTDIDGAQFLPLAVIYGPNGSGKSTAFYRMAQRPEIPMIQTIASNCLSILWIRSLTMHRSHRNYAGNFMNASRNLSVQPIVFPKNRRSGHCASASVINSSLSMRLS